jgi:hypothetical protein
MKRLDKPTKHKRDNLLNFKKKTAVPLKILPKGKLSKSLTNKISFLWLLVSWLNLMESHIFHVHLKPTHKITVEGEVT